MNVRYGVNTTVNRFKPCDQCKLKTDFAALMMGGILRVGLSRGGRQVVSQSQLEGIDGWGEDNLGREDVPLDYCAREEAIAILVNAGVEVLVFERVGRAGLSGCKSDVG